LDLEPVDGHGDQVLRRDRRGAAGRGVRRDGHLLPPHTVEAAWSIGRPRCSMCWTRWLPERGDAPPGPPDRLLTAVILRHLPTRSTWRGRTGSPAAPCAGCIRPGST